MSMRMFLPRAIFGILYISCLVSAEWINSEISRVVNAKEHIVRVKTEYVVAEGSGEYLVAYPEEMAQKIAYISAAVGGKGVDTPITKKETRDGFALYAVDLGRSKLLTVSTVVVNPFELLPAQISQQEPQFVVYTDTELVPSPYRTETQTTKMKLASRNIESVDPTPKKTTGQTVTWGPVTDVNPFECGEMGSLRVHFMNNFPFAVAHDVLREIEVSNWGNIAVEEVYEVRHTGAELKGGFSRLDYMVKRLKESPSFRSLKAVIPGEATNIYYRDQIGNVSTSSLTPNSDGNLEFNIQPRFPMFGGWKTEWYQGWNLPSEFGLTHSGSSYTLTMDFGIPFEDMWVEDLIVKVILPEGATDVKASVPFEVEEGRSQRSTYLDTPVMGGRPIVAFRKTNVVKEHNQPFVVTYSFNSFLMLHEPAVCIMFFMACFIISMIVSRVDLSMSKKKDKKAEKSKKE